MHCRNWTGTNLESRLMQENIITKRFMSLAFEKTPHIGLICMLVPVQNWHGNKNMVNSIEKPVNIYTLQCFPGFLCLSITRHLGAINGRIFSLLPLITNLDRVGNRRSVRHDL